MARFWLKEDVRFNQRGFYDSPPTVNQKMTRNELLNITIAEVGEEEIDAHFHLLPDCYFVSTPKDEIELHVRMINQLLHEINHAESIGTLKPIIKWVPNPEESLTTVNVVTWDRAGLFHKLAGALNIAGYNILGATAIARSDNIAIDTFFVQEDESGHSIHSKSIFEEILGNTLISNEDLYPRIHDLFHFQYSSLSKIKGNPIAQSFHPKIEIYQELSLKSAILKTQAPDTPGLLYKIARQLHTSGYDIISASISTKQGIAINTLNFRSATPNKSVEREALVETSDQILQAITQINPFN